MGQDLIQYDEDAAVKFIQNFMPQDLKDKYSKNDINYVIDLVYDFYDSKGFMDEDVAEDAQIDIDEDEVVEYVLKYTQNDKKTKFDSEDIPFIVQGEMAYCESIGIFES